MRHNELKKQIADNGVEKVIDQLTGYKKHRKVSKDIKADDKALFEKIRKIDPTIGETNFDYVKHGRLKGMFTSTETETAFGYAKESKVDIKVLKYRVKFMKHVIKGGKFGEQGDRSLRWAKHHLAGLELKLVRAIEKKENEPVSVAKTKAKAKSKAKGTTKKNSKAKVATKAKVKAKVDLSKLTKAQMLKMLQGK